MKKLKVIDDIWEKEGQPEWVKNVLTVGDKLPKLGEIYIPETEYWDDGKLIAYKLEEFDFSNYGNHAGLFKQERFEVISDDYTPNFVVSFGDNTFLAEKANIIATFSFLSDSSEIVNLKTFIKE
jgi:hypothetical protein